MGVGTAEATTAMLQLRDQSLFPDFFFRNHCNLIIIRCVESDAKLELDNDNALCREF